jgi:hypothetical protein
MLLALAACQGQGSEAPKASAGSGSSQAAGSSSRPGGVAGTERSSDAGTANGAANEAANEPPAPKLTSVQLIAKLGAVPVWEGVVQRGQLLARRGQRGVLVGRVGPAVGEGSLVWLVDDTEGEGSLAARAAFSGAAPAAGARIAATGAWVLSEAPVPSAPLAPAAGAAPPSAPAISAAPAAPRRWIWQVELVTGLPEEGSPPVMSSPIGHEVKAGPRPAEAVPISKAKDNDLVVFQVLAAPRRLGEAWLVADQLGNPPVAMLSMPGDRASYGGIDFRQPDEQWRLRRGVSYVVRIGKIRRKDPLKPAAINARNAPTKI